MRKKLYVEQAVKNLETDPTSMTELAKELDTSIGYLQYHFGAECKALSQNYIANVADKAEQSNNKRRQHIKTIVAALHEQGIYPSKN